MRSTVFVLLATATLLSGCITTERERHRKRSYAAQATSAMQMGGAGATIAYAKH